MTLEPRMEPAAVRKLFKCTAGVLNNAFTPEEGYPRCEAEVKAILGEGAVCSFESVCEALAKAIQAGVVPEEGLQTLRTLAPHFDKHGLLTGSAALPRALGLQRLLPEMPKWTLHVVNMAGEKTSHEVESGSRILGLKCQLGLPFGTKAQLTFEGTLLQDAQSFAEAGVVDGSELFLVHEKMTWEEDQKSGVKDLLSFLEPHERVDAVVFGDWGWGNDGEIAEALRVPEERRKTVLTPYEASCYMEGWSYLGGYGAPECYASYVYTDRRVIFVSQYDGLTQLEGIPLRPMPCTPTMPGG
ncbi:Uncharacterized protein SCF082_LOCUS21633 [Durusdinium trenchii]|uniref:Ubiquitin-like domain-containing protein n=1 Tax=Durusdinium trenchii TaxID=1381693 RepID=A0ABP0LAL3_9DINO